MVLTKRRKEIMELIVNGASNSEIGYELGIAEQTVKNTVHQIFLKLGAKNRPGAVAIWLRKYKGGAGYSGNHGRVFISPITSRPVWCHDCNLGQHPAPKGG